MDFPLQTSINIDDFSIKTSIEFEVQPRLSKGLMLVKQWSPIFPTFVGGINMYKPSKIWVVYHWFTNSTCWTQEIARLGEPQPVRVQEIVQRCVLSGFIPWPRGPVTMGSRVQLKRLWDLKKIYQFGFYKKGLGNPKKKTPLFWAHGCDPSNWCFLMWSSPDSVSTIMENMVQAALGEASASQVVRAAEGHRWCKLSQTCAVLCR